MYNRIYESMFEGSMVGAGALTFAVWSYVLGKMKPSRKDGKFYVEINPVLLAAVLGEAIGEVEEVIDKLCGPDERSRTQDEKGARLAREGQFLYRVVNGTKYNEIRSHEERREYQRIKQAEYRRKRTRSPNGMSKREQKRVRAENDSRMDRFEDAIERGEEALADQIASENLPGE